MNIISEEKVIVLRIEYDNSEGSTDRDKIYEYLDAQYTPSGYRATRSGPHSNPTKRALDLGLMIVHADAPSDEFVGECL